MPKLQDLDKDDIVYLCLEVLDEIITTHADSGTLKNIANEGIKAILKQANYEHEEYGKLK
jgi:hypothetical protein